MIDEKKLIEELRPYYDKVLHQNISDDEKLAKHDMLSDVMAEIKKQIKIGGWIPCGERLPEMSEYMEFEPTPYMKRLEIAYMTDTVEYLIGFYDGCKWMDKHHNIIKNVMAWKPFLKLPEEYYGQRD